MPSTPRAKFNWVPQTSALLTSKDSAGCAIVASCARHGPGIAIAVNGAFRAGLPAGEEE
jgi:hypothetical protein